MNVIAYIRVSTDGQVGEDKFGLDSQRNQIMAYCAANGHNIIGWYADEGESGAKERPGFDRIIYSEEISNPPAEAVVVAKSDRVARDINVYYYYKMMLRKKNMGLISISEDFGQMGVFAAMLEAFTMCAAQMERENITKRTAGGRRVKADRGGYAGGGAPYGYEAKNGALTVVPAEADAVRHILRMREDGATYTEIIRDLEARGIRPRKAAKWTVPGLEGMMRKKPVYEGKYRYGGARNGGDTPWVEGQQEAILVRGDDGKIIDPLA